MDVDANGNYYIHLLVGEWDNNKRVFYAKVSPDMPRDPEPMQLISSEVLSEMSFEAVFVGANIIG